jgi:hypothetical protein
MDLRADQIPHGIDWSQLSELQKEVLKRVMLRCVPVVHTMELIQSWYVSRRLVLFNTEQRGSVESPWRVAYQLDGTKKYRVICDVNPNLNSINWWVQDAQFRSRKTPEKGFLIPPETKTKMAKRMDQWFPHVQSGSAQGSKRIAN